MTEKIKIDLENIIQNNKKVLIDFFAPWCPPCVKLMTILDQLEISRPDVKLVKINFDLYKDLVSQNNVKKLPTLILYKEGKKIDEKIGFCSFEDLLSFVDQK
ncbi:thioredoxin family protein [Candidatus Phytoplasma oryzae]|nr:thioredoxin family protein [Candidatus Phytoplasma oryzae]